MSKVNTFIIPIIRPDFVERMLFTLYRYTPRDSFNVIVIDQTGTKEAQDKAEKYAHLWIRPYRNLGFSKAMNIGAVLSQTPYITMANDDIEFMDNRWWPGIIDTFSMDKNIIAINPMSPKEGSWGYGLTNENQETWQPPEEYVCEPGNKLSVYPKIADGQGLFYKEEFSSTDYDFLLTEHKRYKPGTLVDAIAMWCTVFTREGLEENGLLDEKFYPGGGEDYDMNARAYSCAWPEERDVCDPKFHRRMVSTTKSWVWHHWGKSKDAISAVDPGNKLFTSRERWNANEELWSNGFDVWGHKNTDGVKIPYKRIPQVHTDDL